MSADITKKAQEKNLKQH